MSSDKLDDAPPHEFEPGPQDPLRCGFEWSGLPCGYARADHSHVWAVDWQYRADARAVRDGGAGG